MKSAVSLYKEQEPTSIYKDHHSSTYNEEMLTFYRTHWGGVLGETKNINNSVRGQSFLLHFRKPTAWSFLSMWLSGQFNHGPEQNQNAALRLLLRWIPNQSWGTACCGYVKSIHTWRKNYQSRLGLWVWTTKIIWKGQMRWISSRWD